MKDVWAGIDAGKTAHHCVVIDADGDRLLSRRINNDETEIVTLLNDVAKLADGGKTVWATDLNSGGAALLLAHLVTAKQTVFYIPGRMVHHAAAGYRGEGKTDAKDAAIIADQARMRRDLQPVRVADDTAVSLRILTGHRTDLMRDRTRTINRLRALLDEFFPALERALDLAHNKGNLILLTGYQTPDGIRRYGRSRLEGWLRKNGAYNPAKVAATAIEAAQQQTLMIPGQATAAATIASLARCALELGTRLTELDSHIHDEFHRHRYADILESMPGIGPLLGAEFVAATGGDMKTANSSIRMSQRDVKKEPEK